MFDIRHIAARIVGCLLLCCVAASAQYAGPSLLSRGGNTPGARGRSPVDFTYYGGAKALYESGLLLAQTDTSGELQPLSGWGLQLDAGLYGGKAFRRSSFGVDYRIDYRNQTAARRLKGLSQTFSMQYQNQVKRRVSFFTGVSAGVMQRAFGVFSIPASPSQADFGLPLMEVYDNRTVFGQANAGATWQKTARLSVSGVGSAFFMQRDSAGLYNGQGGSLAGTANYRSSARTSWYLSYQYARMWFPKAFATVNSHVPVVGVTHRMTRSLEANLDGGIALVDLTGVEQVALSPLVAAILGRTTGSQAYERKVNFPTYNARLSYFQERSRTTVGVSSAMNGGNGLFRASRRTSFSAGHSYSGIRKLSLAASANYSTMSALGENLSDLGIRAVGGSANYVLAEHLQLTTQYDYRWFQTELVRTRRGHVLSIGLTLTPSRLPLAIW